MFDRVLNTPLILEDFKMEERVTVLPQRFVRKNSFDFLKYIHSIIAHVFLWIYLNKISAQS